MLQELKSLVERLVDPRLKEADVITWGSPIISFGSLSNSKIATLGLNPSNREFIDQNGKELVGSQRRFHTLYSLGISTWSDIQETHLDSIAELCEEYFQRNPYDSWFKRLDYLISGTSMSYYFPSNEACHLDLIPYATASKWANLSGDQKKALLHISGDTLGLILRSSKIQILILNGQTVVDHLEKICDMKLEKMIMSNWTLPRRDSNGVIGYSYTGVVKNIGGVELGHEIRVLGYNHNIQSSFGVTSEVQKSIRSWISLKSKEIFK